MRNSLMKEKLDAAFLAPSEVALEEALRLSNDEVLGAVSAVRRKLSKAPAALNKSALRKRKTAVTGRAARRGGLQDTKDIASTSAINSFSIYAHPATKAPVETAEPAPPPADETLVRVVSHFQNTPLVTIEKNISLLGAANHNDPTSDANQGHGEPSPDKTEVAAQPLLAQEKTGPPETLPISGLHLTPAAAASVVVAPAPAADLEIPLMPVLPPNLEWLNKPTPFSNNLRGMAESLRTAKTALNCRLEMTLKTLKDFRAKVEYEESQESRLREDLRQIDDTLSACALVAEQSASIRPELLAPDLHHKKYGAADGKPGGKKQSVNYSRRWNLEDNTVCRREDVVNFFKANPDANWDAREVRNALPAQKQAHGKIRVPGLLAELTNDGIIKRVTTGVYRKS
jgi:hypothetical protein